MFKMACELRLDFSLEQNRAGRTFFPKNENNFVVPILRSNLNKKLHTRLVRCCIFTSVLNGVEVWTLIEILYKRLERHLTLKNSQTTIARIINVYRAKFYRTIKQSEIINTVKRTQLKYFGAK